MLENLEIFLKILLPAMAFQMFANSLIIPQSPVGAAVVVAAAATVAVAVAVAVAMDATFRLYLPNWTCSE
jgi:hypothetical protein